MLQLSDDTVHVVDRTPWLRQFWAELTKVAEEARNDTGAAAAEEQIPTGERAAAASTQAAVEGSTATAQSDDADGTPPGGQGGRAGAWSVEEVGAWMEETFPFGVRCVRVCVCVSAYAVCRVCVLCM